MKSHFSMSGTTIRLPLLSAIPQVLAESSFTTFQNFAEAG
jgi:hypothetical protein